MHHRHAPAPASLILLELDPAKLIQLKICCQGARGLGYVVLQVARPGGISRDQGPRVSTCYEWRVMKGRARGKYLCLVDMKEPKRHVSVAFSVFEW